MQRTYRDTWDNPMILIRDGKGWLVFDASHHDSRGEYRESAALGRVVKDGSKWVYLSKRPLGKMRRAGAGAFG
jgi:hypothetical protein